MKTLRERNDEEEFASHCDMVSPMCLPEVDGEFVAPHPLETGWWNVKSGATSDGSLTGYCQCQHGTNRV